MSNQYDNRNTGVLFNNDKKTTDKHPHFRGQAQIVGPDGEVMDMWISAWIKNGQKGEFLSLSFSPKDALPNAGGGGSFSSMNAGATGTNHAPAPAQAASAGVPDLNDEVPF